MAIEMWFQEDMRNILLSINASSASNSRWSDSPQARAYRQGYQEALLAVALACGIPPTAIGANLGSGIRPNSAPPLDAGSARPG